jgi:hypothetical protein
MNTIDYPYALWMMVVRERDTPLEQLVRKDYP